MPLSDAKDVDELLNDPLIGQAYKDWLTCFIAWNHAAHVHLNEIAAGGQEEVRERVAKLFGATLLPEGSPTMAHWMERYRDVMVVYGGDEHHFDTPSRVYFDVELAVATLYAMLAEELVSQLGLLLSDLLEYRVCMMPYEAGFQSADHCGKLDERIERVGESLRIDFKEMLEAVIYEYGNHMKILAQRERHQILALEELHPWLTEQDTAYSKERQHLIELTKRVLTLHGQENGSAWRLTLQYEELLKWLDKHYVHPDTPADVCVLTDGYNAALHEYGLVQLNKRHLVAEQEWVATEHEKHWRDLGVRVWTVVFSIENEVLLFTYSSPGCDVAPPAASLQAHWRDVAEFSTNQERQRMHTPELDIALNSHLSKIYEGYTIIHRVLESEIAREKLVVPDRRLLMVPKSMHDDLLMFSPPLQSTLGGMELVDHLSLAEADNIRTINETEVETTFESVAAQQAVLAKVHGVSDSGRSLHQEMFPMNDIILARVFYSTIHERVSAERSAPLDPDVVANAVNIMRFHAARVALVELIGPQERIVFAGVAEHHSGGQGDYYSALGWFFYILARDYPEEYRAVLADGKVFGDNPESILQNYSIDKGYFNHYVRGEVQAASYLRRTGNALDVISSTLLLNIDTAGAAVVNVEGIKSVWETLREPLWWGAFSETLENKHFETRHWFTREFLPRFIAVDTVASSGQPMFTRPSVAVVETEIGANEFNQIAWMWQSVRQNAQAGLTDSVKKDNIISYESTLKNVEDLRERVVVMLRDQANLQSASPQLPTTDHPLHEQINQDLFGSGAAEFLRTQYLATIGVK